ncbi:hypothetical protein GCM10018779_64680 [Streptomyces griseocarneus]|nr:hypothetical protein GCM10018779_64680 [Streptomyces griseocarneus]
MRRTTEPLDSLVAIMATFLFRSCARFCVVSSFPHPSEGDPRYPRRRSLPPPGFVECMSGYADKPTTGALPKEA